MCFVIVPQRRALFQHLNFQKCSGAEHVDFEICFAPQRRISTSESAPNMCVCVTSTCASCRNGVHFFHISTSQSSPSMKCFWHVDFAMCFAPQQRPIFHFSSPRWLRTCRFSEHTFWPSAKHWKKQCLATFLPFRAPASSFFWLFLFSALLSDDSLSSLTLTSAFPSVHIAGSLTSKLPSATNYSWSLKIQWTKP